MSLLDWWRTVRPEKAQANASGQLCRSCSEVSVALAELETEVAQVHDLLRKAGQRERAARARDAKASLEMGSPNGAAEDPGNARRADPRSALRAQLAALRAAR